MSEAPASEERKIAELENRMTQVETAIRHRNHEARAAGDLRPWGPSIAQGKAEETWARRIDRLTELTGLPTAPLVMLFAVALGIAIPLLIFMISAPLT